MNILRYFGSILPCFASSCPSQTENVPNKKDEKHLKTFQEELGFSSDIAINHPDCALFLMESKIAYIIAMFRNSTPVGQERHQLRIDHNGHPLLKVEGEWMRWENLQELIIYDNETEQLVSKTNSHEVWAYISPDGFVKKDPYGCQELYPIEQISQEKQKELLAAAKSFVFEQPTFDEAEEKDCILQVYTTKREAVSRNWLTSNFLDNAIEHPGIRIIEASGAIYSFGAVMPRKDAREIEKAAPFDLLATGIMKVRSLDHEEGYNFQERRVTSIPLSSKKAKEILEFASSVNTQEPRFNLLRQNCVKFATMVLKKAGVEVDTRVKVGQFFKTVFPDVTTLPVIRQISSFASGFIQKISSFVTPIFASLQPYIPAPIKQACALLDYVDRKVWTVFWNLISIPLFGSTKVKRPLPQEVEPVSQMNDNELIQFERLISSPEEIFDEEKLDMYFSPKLAKWQKRQATTVIHQFDGQSRLCL